ncbi:MAG TPA: tetratricopeptide repeat protein, partial [Chitinophagaceae bacterium]|nr:tetratricopeptide repeat protein [Chitinophagaceae bacterium]
IQLNVDKVLEGSVRKSGNRVRITAQLINAADGYHIWSENYDRNLTDIFEVQDEISGIIADKLRHGMTTTAPREHLVKTPTQNLSAYTSFLKGLHFWNRMTPADTWKAIECWEKALETEPSYANAYAMIAGAYGYLGSTGQMEPEKAFRFVNKFATKALGLDDQLSEGYTAKASYHLFYEWNWKPGYEALEKAIALNPGAIEAYELLSFYYVLSGRKEEAVTIMEKAEEMDPLSPIVIQQLAISYIFNERYDDAIRQVEKLLEMHPQMRSALETKAWCIAMKGDWNTARQLFEELHRLTNHPLKGLMGLGFTYGKLGEKEKALECISKMEQRQLQEPEAVIDADLAAVWFALGDLDKTFYYINRCIDRRMAPAIYFLEFPAYAGIKNDPRYKEISDRILNESGGVRLENSN